MTGIDKAVIILSSKGRETVGLTVSAYSMSAQFANSAADAAPLLAQESSISGKMLPVTATPVARVQRARGKPSEAQLLNRELGILAFNERVLQLAHDPTTPILERLRFICIVSGNLDEFYEIRVAGLREQLLEDAAARADDGLTAREVFTQVSARAKALVDQQYELLNTQVLPSLAKAGVRVLYRPVWTATLEKWAHAYFRREIFPLLTPIGLDPAHPFPKVLNKSLNFAVTLEGRDAYGRGAHLAIVQAPRALPRVIRTPARDGEEFILLSTILIRYIGDLFPGMTVTGCHSFRVTRNSDLFVEEEELVDLRQALQGELPQRHLGDAVRLEVINECPPAVVELLIKQSELSADDVYFVGGPVNLSRLASVVDLSARADLKFAAWTPLLPPDLPPRRHGVPGQGAAEFFGHLAKHDVLLHHPFESFDPVVRLLAEAAHDPDVVAIKQTIYRTGAKSELMQLLLTAARNGKEVTVVLELMARFDEETNINWASRLEEMGVHVVYGVVGNKTHAKMLLVIRRETEVSNAKALGKQSGKSNKDSAAKPGKIRLRRYVHLGTGNYHPSTARLYTDFGLLTANERICDDVANVFQQLTGFGVRQDLSCLWQAPFALHEQLKKAIHREARNARAGKKARIMAKMNSLLEPQIIHALYKASRAGVKIDLIVRGACALRPGVPGLSENIRVASVLGRFLEHSRIYYFYAGGDEQVMLASADWMDRNFFRRIEIAFPVNDAALKARVIREGLRPYLKAQPGVWLMDGRGGYHANFRGEARADDQHPQAALMALFSNA